MLRVFLFGVFCLAVVGCDDDKASTAPSAVAEDAAADAVSEGSDTAVRNEETSAPGETCSEDSLEACQYSPERYEIDDVEGVLGQKVYARELPLLIRFPTDAEGPRPVVIVSHGGTFSTDGHKKLMKPWGKALAQAGYIAIHLAHTPFDMDKMPQLCEQQGILPADCDPEAVSYTHLTLPTILRV